MAEENEEEFVPLPRHKTMTLLGGVFVVAGCGLAYELVMSTAAAYFLGDTVTQFSVTIGIFLSALGLGAALSRRIKKNLLTIFVLIEIAVAFIGGLSAAVIYVAYGWTEATRSVTIVLPVIVGVLVGLEIPILTRLLAPQAKLRVVLSNVLSFDYFGGLLAALAYPLLLLPGAGVVRSALVFGTLNAVVALITSVTFRNDSPGVKRLVPVAALTLVTIIGGFWASHWLISSVEQRLYRGDIVALKQTKFQRVAVVKGRHGGVDMFLDGHVQFSSIDERRYHEAMTHPAMGAPSPRENVLIIGGGDGLIAREVLRYPDVKRIVLVDIDGELMEMSRTQPLLTALNEGSLEDPRVTVEAADGFVWLRDHRDPWDRIFMDLPDPRSEGVARLYSVEFFNIVRDRLNPGGVVVAQAASPFYTPRAYWSAVKTVETAGLTVKPAHVNVPSFGEWGFVYATRTPMEFDGNSMPEGLHFLTPAGARAMFEWPLDLPRQEVEASHFDRPIILRYYADDARRWK